MSDILDDLARYEAQEKPREWGLEPRWQAEPELLLDLGGRLHLGDKVLPWAPASSIVGGTTDAPLRPDQHARDPASVRGASWQSSPLAIVSWRETTIEAHERQAGVR